MIADTTHIPAIFAPLSIPTFSAFKPPMAQTGIGTASHMLLRVSTDVSTVFTFVVVGYIALTPR